MKKYIPNVRLTRKATQWAWNEFGEYSYSDEDEVCKDWSEQMTSREKRIDMGLPRYFVMFDKVPLKRKREITVRMKFDDYGRLEDIDTLGNVTKHQLKDWIIEAVFWLRNNGYLEEQEHK